jgi:hypothetical protein
MGAIARFVMQGPRQAMIVAVLTAALPLLYWVSAAVVSLVLLRHGLTKSLNIIVVALLPGLVWWVWQHEMMQLLVVLGAVGMALILRLTVSLPVALMTSIVLGAAVILLVPGFAPEWHTVLEKAAQEYLVQLEQEPQLKTLLADKVLPSLLGGVAAMVQLFAMGALLLARHWQSALYNPGAYQAEFIALRMPRWYAAVTLVALLLASSNNTLLAFVPVVVTPLFIAGIALIHSGVQYKKLSGQWLLAFYISLLFFLPYMYALLILVAVADSLLNLRRWLEDKANP